MKKQMILLGMLMAFCMAEAKVTLPALFTDNKIICFFISAKFVVLLSL